MMSNFIKHFIKVILLYKNIIILQHYCEMYCKNVLCVSNQLGLYNKSENRSVPTQTGLRSSEPAETGLEPIGQRLNLPKTDAQLFGPGLILGRTAEPTELIKCIFF